MLQISRQTFRSIARRLAPGIMADRARRYQRARREKLGITKTVEGLDPIVQSGPFAGLRYPAEQLADVDVPAAKLSGTYEHELIDIFEAMVGCPLFVDIGAADGYFAVGMAHASPHTVVYAYDIAPSARELCATVARLNSVEQRVTVRRQFKAADLRGVDLTGSLVLCDIEGAERRLFDPGLAARLAGARIVIEVHESAVPGTRAHLERVFAATHDLRPVHPTARDRRPELAENRPAALHWIDLTPR